mgnify:CR=1 FL=1
MVEKEIEKLFCRKVKQAGGKAYKFVSPGNSGVPDRLVILPGGKIGFVELKAPGKAPRPDKDHQIRCLENMGCYVAVADQLGQLDQIIREIAEYPDPDFRQAVLEGGRL